MRKNHFTIVVAASEESNKLLIWAATANKCQPSVKRAEPTLKAAAVAAHRNDLGLSSLCVITINIDFKHMAEITRGRVFNPSRKHVCV